jgi:hypothetical protein
MKELLGMLLWFAALTILVYRLRLRFGKKKQQPRKRSSGKAKISSPATAAQRGKQGEDAVNAVLEEYCRHSGAYLLDNITMKFKDGTTQIDHILLTKKGILVIETKNYSGWIFAETEDSTWTQVTGQNKNTFQNPLRQNYKHWLAVQSVLPFLPQEIMQSIVVFTGNAQFKTDIPEGVLFLDELKDFLDIFDFGRITAAKLKRSVTSIQKVMLEQSTETDQKHIAYLKKKFSP